MKNKYETIGEVTKVFVKGPEGRVHETLIDTEDLELVKWISGSWRAVHSGNGKDLYVVGHLYESNIFLHRLVTNSLNVFNKEIDHIKHNTLDNRKSELRIVTKGENQQNRRLGVNNKSGALGVHYSEDKEKWIARIGINGKRKELGEFIDKEDAIRVRKEAEIKYHTYKQSICD